MPKTLKGVQNLDLNVAFRRVMNWFFAYPNTETGLNDLSSDVKLSKTTAKRAVEHLVQEGFLSKKIYGRTWRIVCNQEHFYNQTFKVAYNLEQIFFAYHKTLRKSILKQAGNARAVILFGSYRKGDDTDKSDIDIAVEVQDNKELRIIELGVLPRIGSRHSVPVNIHIFSRDKIDLNLFANIANGIALEGFLEVRP